MYQDIKNSINHVETRELLNYYEVSTDQAHSINQSMQTFNITSTKTFNESLAIRFEFISTWD